MSEGSKERAPEMSVGEYVSAMMSELDAFFDYYNVWREVQPDNFPERMPPGEWDEQFHAWEQSNADGGESDGTV
jgi:hypothetical protein